MFSSSTFFSLNGNYIMFLKVTFSNWEEHKKNRGTGKEYKGERSLRKVLLFGR